MIQLQRAGTQVVAEAVTQLIDMGAFEPMQGSNTATSRFGVDDVVHFTIGLSVDFEAGKVTDFCAQGSAIGLADVYFAQPMAGAVVGITFVIVGFILAFDQGHPV
ncbi:hypothetical protein D9M69_686070 [compost metagenome]